MFFGTLLEFGKGKIDGTKLNIDFGHDVNRKNNQKINLPSGSSF